MAQDDPSQILIKWLLDRRVDPNRTNRFGKTAFHNAVLSDNALPIIEVLLDHGANAMLVADRPDRIRTAEAKPTSPRSRWPSVVDAVTC